MGNSPGPARPTLSGCHARENVRSWCVLLLLFGSMPVVLWRSWSSARSSRARRLPEVVLFLAMAVWCRWLWGESASASQSVSSLLPFFSRILRFPLTSDAILVMERSYGRLKKMHVVTGSGAYSPWLRRRCWANPSMYVGHAPLGDVLPTTLN